MKTININFDVKSIKNAIKEVKEVQKKMQKEVPQAFITRCLNWVRVRANDYLNNFNIDGGTVSDIISNWHNKIEGNVGKLVNTSSKAVFIEFGVGRIGAVASHPSANENNPPYEYNVESDKKDGYGKWRFKTNDKFGIDLVEGYYTIKNDTVTTSGSPATLYLYNAMMDLISSGVFKKLWQDTLNNIIK